VGLWCSLASTAGSSGIVGQLKKKMMIRWSGAPKRPANLGRGWGKLLRRNSNPSSPTNA